MRVKLAHHHHVTEWSFHLKLIPIRGGPARTATTTASFAFALSFAFAFAIGVIVTIAYAISEALRNGSIRGVSDQFVNESAPVTLRRTPPVPYGRGLKV